MPHQRDRQRPMHPAEVLAYVRGSLPRARVSKHCRERMAERGAGIWDVRRAIESATEAKLEERGTWKLLGGCDVDGDPLIVIVDVRTDPVTLVTVHDV